MPRRRLAALLIATAAALAVALAVLAPAPSYAASEHHRDARHDVDYVDPPDYRNPHPAPGNRFADVLEVTTRYGEHALVLQVRVRRLLRHFHGVSVSVDVPGRRDFRVEEADYGPVDELVLTRITGDTYQDVPCRGLARRVDVRRDRLGLFVPARCLGRGRSLRTAFSFGVYDADAGSGGLGRSWFDDARVTGDDGDFEPAYGPEVARG